MPRTGAREIGLDTYRKPRAHIEAVVFTFGARRKQEIPFLIGVMSDIIPASGTPQPDLAGRKFLEFDSTNFSDRMAAAAPELSYRAPNPFNTAEQLPVKLVFKSMEDFRPNRVARQVAPIRELLEERERLANLKKDLDGPNAKAAEKVLIALIKKAEALKLERAKQLQEAPKSN